MVWKMSIMFIAIVPIVPILQLCSFTAEIVGDDQRYKSFDGKQPLIFKITHQVFCAWNAELCGYIYYIETVTM